MKLPGTLWLNRGRWNWKVKLPGDVKRRNIPLKMPNGKIAIPEERGRDVAESLAWRLWGKATKEELNSPRGELVDDVVRDYLEWSKKYYGKFSSRGGDSANIEAGMRLFRQAYGGKGINDIRYEDILSLREKLEISGITRGVINQRVGIWKRFFSWALENRRCSAAAKMEVQAISPLKYGRSAAPEQRMIMPVRHLYVKRTLPYLCEEAQAAIQLMELCGARPGEIVTMRPMDIEWRHNCAIYRPALHKTAYRGQLRVIVLGKRAMNILQKWMPSKKYRQDERIFFPHRPDLSNLLAQNVREAIKRAVADGENIPFWTPNQLRHACGTRIRKRFGLDTAKAALGHSAGGSNITDRYTREAMEAEIIRKVLPAAELFG